MNEKERAAFLEAIEQALDLMRRAHGSLQAAQSKCHGNLYTCIEPMGKRMYELRINAEWLKQAALGRVSVESADQPDGRQNSERRQSLDRRVEGMRKKLLSLNGSGHASHAPRPQAPRLNS
jgi:hypothetical protein